MKTIFTTLTLLSFSAIGFSQLNEIDAPVENFEKLWKEFDYRYANFELKEVEWYSIHEQYRDSINERTTNRKLFEMSCLMLQELNDGHVTISSDFDEGVAECGPPYKFSLEVEFNTEEKIRQFESTIDLTLENNGFSEPVKTKLSEDTNFQYRVSESLAYLRLDEMTETLTFGKFKKAVDRSIKEFQQKKALIIDLRFNGGGWDYNAYNLASRFVPKGKTVGHFERTRIKGTNEYTPLKYKTVKSGGRNQFLKPVVILTSDFTASAAEVFLMIMKELPNATIVGDSTEGIFSVMYEFKLPNKWNVTLSHQQFFSKNKENYEGKGIPPDIKILNSMDDIENQNDSVLEKAFHYLEK